MSVVEGAWMDGFGWWQVRLAFLLALPVMLTGIYGTNYVFLAADTPHRCHVPECEANASALLTPTAEEWAPVWWAWALPSEHQHCTMRWTPTDAHCGEYSFSNTTMMECDNFIYQHRSSIVPEFELACQEWKRTLVGTIHNVGMLISMPLMGYISDRYGRRTALVVSGAGAGFLGLAKSFAPSYYTYLMAELLETILGASVYPAAFVLLIEWLGVKQRIYASLLLGIPLAMGSATLSLLDYLTGYWRFLARVAYPPSFILLLYPWLLPESVRWLCTRGRVHEAVETIKVAASYNRIVIPEQALEKMLTTESEKVPEKVEVGNEEESLFRAFIKYGVLRRRLCVCFVWWCGAVFVFYGLAVRASALAGSRHVAYALVAAAELPALAANTLLLDRAGRRPTLTIALLITAVALIAMTCLPAAATTWATALYLIGKVGATMALNALYMYSAELFPTRARHRLLAACSTAGRVGAILAPLTPLLARYYWWLPTALFGGIPLLSAMLTRLVPDTLHQRLPDCYADLQPDSDGTEDEEIA